MPFFDRREAGRKLAERLLTLREERVVVLALPRGGVPVGFEIAQALPAPLDLILARKVGAPHQEELAIGAVAEGNDAEFVADLDLIASLHVSSAYIAEAKTAAFAELERRRAIYRGDREPLDVTGLTVVVADDGIATGMTMLAALRAIRRRKPARLVLAVPVAPPATLKQLRHEVDQLLCLEKPLYFSSVSKAYRRFPQLTDADVIALLTEAHSFAPG